MIQRHLGRHVSLLPILVGTYAPDTFTKWFVYGVDLGFIKLAADDPAQFHRGWPGAGFTHKVGDVVTISSRKLGRLSNTVTTSRDAPAWTMGITEFIRNLAARGLVDKV